MAEAMSAEELEALGKTLAEMGLKPKADNPKHLSNGWSNMLNL